MWSFLFFSFLLYFFFFSQWKGTYDNKCQWWMGLELVGKIRIYLSWNFARRKKGGNWVLDGGWKVVIKTIEGVKLKKRYVHAYSFESWKLTPFLKMGGFNFLIKGREGRGLWSSGGKGLDRFWTPLLLSFHLRVVVVVVVACQTGLKRENFPMTKKAWFYSTNRLLACCWLL